MGKGDKKSKRGKIAIGSYGVKRKKKTAAPISKKAPKASVVNETDESNTSKKAPAKKKVTKKEEDK